MSRSRTIAATVALLSAIGTAAATPASAQTDPRKVCGSGYRSIGHRALLNYYDEIGGTLHILRNRRGRNCAVAVKRVSVGRATPMRLVRQYGPGNRGRFKYYAGPLRWRGGCEAFTADMGRFGAENRHQFYSATVWVDRAGMHYGSCY